MAPVCGQVPFGCQPAAGKMGGDLACVRGLPTGWGCTHRSSGALQGSRHFPPNPSPPPSLWAPTQPSGVSMPSTPLTVADVVVSVADAQVAPAVLHAVAAIGALGVHVAGRGCDFCGGRKKPYRRSS